MDQYRENLDRLSDLSEDELKSLKDTVVADFKTAETQDLTPDVVKTMTELANAKEAITSEMSARVEQAAQLSAQAAEAAARMVDAEDAPDEVAEEAVASADETDIPEDAIEEADELAIVVDEEDVVDEDVPVVVEEDDVVEPDEEDDKEKFFASKDEDTAEQPAESEASTTEVETVIETPVAEFAAEEKPEKTIPEADFASEEVNQESSEEPVTASAPLNSDGIDIEVPADRRPNATVEHAKVTITAGADIPRVAMGSELPDLKAVGSALLARKNAMGRTSGGDGEQHQVAQFTTSLPADRFLTLSDVDGNREKIDAVLASAKSPEALVAAGGLSGPVPVRYELFGLGDTDRPVKNSLAVFGADRGGVRYVTPPTIKDLNGSVGLWTIQDDIDAASTAEPNPTKPCLRVIAGEEVVVYLDAITLCLTFGNMGARAYPELVQRHTELGMIWHARFAETRLLTRIGTLSTPVTAASKLGAARDIFAQIDQAAAGYRSRHRMDVNAPLRAIFPEWFKNALRSDLVKQIPGDGNDDTFGLVDSKIAAWFKVRNINVTWAMDGETGQIFGAQDANVALTAYPANVIWYLFAEGTFLFLDGGTLDLGLVRDSTLNGTNDYKIFLETFENVAKVGIESIKVTSALAILGASAATIA